MGIYTPPLKKILSLEWGDYLHAIQVRLAGWQVRDATWARWPISLDETRDRSWIDALARFRERCWGVPLREMDAESRALLVGDYDNDPNDPEGKRNTYFFGNLHGAGTATSVIQCGEDWPKAAANVDVARCRARALGRSPTATAASAPWKEIFALERFGAASASRLLLAERPDLYLMLNSASRDGLAEITGVKLPASLTTSSIPGHYEAMLAKVYGTKWWSSHRPRPVREAFLWDARVALLDVFAYAGDGAP